MARQSLAFVVAGKILGFGVLCAAISAVSLVLLVAGLNVPMLGTIGLLALVITLLVAASLGLGLLISIISDSERQAVQLLLAQLLELLLRVVIPQRRIGDAKHRLSAPVRLCRSDRRICQTPAGCIQPFRNEAGVPWN